MQNGAERAKHSWDTQLARNILVIWLFIAFIVSKIFIFFWAMKFHFSRIIECNKVSATERTWKQNCLPFRAILECAFKEEFYKCLKMKYLKRFYCGRQEKWKRIIHRKNVLFMLHFFPETKKQSFLSSQSSCARKCFNRKEMRREKKCKAICYKPCWSNILHKKWNMLSWVPMLLLWV